MTLLTTIIVYAALAMALSPIAVMIWLVISECMYGADCARRDKDIVERIARREKFNARYNVITKPIVLMKPYSISTELALTEPVDATPVYEPCAGVITASDLATLAGIHGHKSLKQRAYEARHITQLETFNARLPALNMALDTLDQDATVNISIYDIDQAWARHCYTSDTICSGVINDTIAKRLGFTGQSEYTTNQDLAQAKA